MTTTALPLLPPTWHTRLMDATVVLGQQGRLVIPAGIRAVLGLQSGDELRLRVVDGRITLERRMEPQEAVAALQAMFAHLPRDRSIVDELLAERRAEVEAENAE